MLKNKIRIPGTSAYAAEITHTIVIVAVLLEYAKNVKKNRMVKNAAKCKTWHRCKCSSRDACRRDSNSTAEICYNKHMG